MDLKNIKSKIILSTIISKYTKLIKKNYLYWGKCLFHKENTPSFMVNDEKEVYHCFGCGAHGDVFSFLMEVHKKPFAEILEELCKTYNIPYKKQNLLPPNNKTQEILKEALTIYVNYLKNTPPIIDYLLKRGIKEASISKFHLGYAPQNQAVMTLLKKYSLEEIKAAGIVSTGTFDRLRDRIIFPIFNEQNKPIAFAGRVITDEKPKYINSGENCLFSKNLCLYNINNIAPHSEDIFLVEGYIDVITMTNYGFTNVVASMGTSVSKSQIFMLLKRTKKIHIILDGDECGTKAAERTINLLLEMLIPGYNIQIGILPHNHDPDSFLRHHPPHAFKNYCKDLSEVLINNIIKNLNLDIPEDLSRAFQRLYTYVNLMQNDSVKASYKIILEKKLKQLSFKYKNNAKGHQNKTLISPPPLSLDIPGLEENIISILLMYPEFLGEFIENLTMIIWKKPEMEEIKNTLILNYNTVLMKELIQEYKNQDKLKKILLYNSSLLEKKEFCKKYLWDLLCLLPMNMDNSLLR